MALKCKTRVNTCCLQSRSQRSQVESACGLKSPWIWHIRNVIKTPWQSNNVSIKHPIPHSGSLCFGTRQTRKRISDEAFVVGYIPASGSCVPKRQTFKQPEVMNMLSYLWVLVNRKVKKQEKQALALHEGWNVTSESGSYRLLERRHELHLASRYPLAAEWNLTRRRYCCSREEESRVTGLQCSKPSLQWAAG